MLWFYLALISAAIWAAVNVIDKYVISGFFKKPSAQLVISGVVQLTVGLAAVILFGMEIPNPIIFAICFVAGILGFIATFFYFKALFSEEVSRAIPVLYMIPIWTMIFAAIFLGETLSAQQGFGIVLLVLGSVLVSVKKTAKWKIGFTLGLMVLASILYAAEDILLKYLTTHLSFWGIFFWESLGFVSGSVVVLAFRRNEVIGTIKRFKKVALLSVGSETLAAVAGIFLIWSFSLGLVSLATAVTSVQPLFVLFYATLLSIFWPRVIKEELRTEALSLKVIAIGLILVGSLLII